MSADEYRQHLTQIIAAARLLEHVPAEEILNSMSRADSIGPILNPTLWSQKHEAMENDGAIVRAALPLIAIARKLRADERLT